MNLKNNISIIFCALWAIGCVATAQANEDGTKFHDWRLACREFAGEDKFCTIIQQLSETENGEFLAEIALQPAIAKEQKRVVLAISTPTNMALTIQPGYRRTVSGEVKTLTWRTCSQTSCLASRVLSVEEVTELKKGRSILVGYQLAKDTQPTIFEVSLSGVTAGLSAIGR